MVDYTINGIRYRKSVGKYKRDAEAVQASIQTQITLGNFDIITQTPIIISLDDLILEYLMKNEITITLNLVTDIKIILSHSKDL